MNKIGREREVVEILEKLKDHELFPQPIKDGFILHIGEGHMYAEQALNKKMDLISFERRLELMARLPRDIPNSEWRIAVLMHLLEKIGHSPDRFDFKLLAARRNLPERIEVKIKPQK
ncbi:MAG: hypothetical protein V1787_03920 [Candidatus Micrarchaeota archaeon]